MGGYQSCVKILSLSGDKWHLGVAVLFFPSFLFCMTHALGLQIKPCPPSYDFQVGLNPGYCPSSHGLFLVVSTAGDLFPAMLNPEQERQGFAFLSSHPSCQGSKTLSQLTQLAGAVGVCFSQFWKLNFQGQGFHPTMRTLSMTAGLGSMNL